MLTVLILHNVESVYFFYSKPVFLYLGSSNLLSLKSDMLHVFKSETLSFLRPTAFRCSTVQYFGNIQKLQDIKIDQIPVEIIQVGEKILTIYYISAVVTKHIKSVALLQLVTFGYMFRLLPGHHQANKE